MLIQDNRAHCTVFCVEVYCVLLTKRAYCNVCSDTFWNTVYFSHIPLYSSQLATSVDIFSEIKTIVPFIHRSLRNSNTYYAVGMLSLNVLMIIFVGKVSKRTFCDCGG